MDSMSVTDLKLFGSSHRGTMLPDRDMAVLIQRFRPPGASPAHCTVEEIVSPAPSPKKVPAAAERVAPPELLHVDAQANKPARVQTRVGAAPSSIPRYTPPPPIPSPQRTPKTSPAPRAASRPSSAASRRSAVSRGDLESDLPSPRSRGSRRSSAHSSRHSSRHSSKRSSKRSSKHSARYDARAQPEQTRSAQQSHPQGPPQGFPQGFQQSPPQGPPQSFPQSPPQGHPQGPQARSAEAPPGPVDWRKVFMDAEFRPEDFADIDVEKENATPFTRREKQEVLFQLIKSYPEESQGQWSMKVPLVELKYEWSRREHYKQEQAQVDAMKIGLKVILHAIEAINQKIKSPIHLKGWARSATHDMSKYDRPLRGLYYMYLKKRQMSPMVELGWIILTSALMWHLQSGSGRAPSELDDVHDVPAPEPKKTSGIDLGSLASLARMFV